MPTRTSVRETEDILWCTTYDYIYKLVSVFKDKVIHIYMYYILYTTFLYILLGLRIYQITTIKMNYLELRFYISYA